MGTRIADLVGLAQIGLSDCEAVIPEGQRLAPFGVLVLSTSPSPLHREAPQVA